MTDPNDHLRGLAGRVVAAAAELGPLRAALLTGSAARGDADLYSDIDLFLYVDGPPAEDALDKLRALVGGTNDVTLGPMVVQFEVDGVVVQLGYATVADIDELLGKMLDELEEPHGPQQKFLRGIAEGRALHGADVVERWQRRVSAYPDALRRSAIEHHWAFFPLWWYQDALAPRDAELFRVEMLVDASLNLLGVLAALNRVYYSRFQLKRLRSLVAELALAPPDVAARIESLLHARPSEAAEELGRLVAEVRELVVRELPDVDLPLRRPPGTTIEPWLLP